MRDLLNRELQPRQDDDAQHQPDEEAHQAYLRRGIDEAGQRQLDQLRVAEPAERAQEQDPQRESLLAVEQAAWRAAVVAAACKEANDTLARQLKQIALTEAGPTPTM